MQRPHDRDAHLTFYPVPHEYRVDGQTGFTSVTTWVHSHFPKFDGPGAARRKLGKGASSEAVNDLVAEWSEKGKEASSAGTEMHEAIEHYYTQGKDLPDTKELAMFCDFRDQHKDMVPYRSEWSVWDMGAKLAGTIDMVYRLPNGKLAIYDWKRCKQIRKAGFGGRCALHPSIDYVPDSNYWHYTLQLNVYRNILERLYGVEVDHCALVQLHPDQVRYRVFKVPNMQQEVSNLLAARQSCLEGAGEVSA